ncbi:MAG: SUF system Fe-S cluster assembly protein [Nitratireductor sp.]|nr:SUF system Fe-S cluster assembly protein [Nitratireductor sp.]MCC0019829.1 SUF system Fe-S cluster assembly protein [Nitratireductor sp.]
MDKAADTENTGEGTMQREIVGAGPNSAAFATSTLPQEELERMTGDIVAALKTVYDPEIPADIYELGLIYRVDIDDDRTVHVQMTLTAPGCPVAGEMPMWVQQAISGVEGVMDVDVDLVFDPPWTPERMSEEAQIAVGMW